MSASFIHSFINVTSGVQPLFYKATSLLNSTEKNTDYVDYILGYPPRWRKTVTLGESFLNKLCYYCFLCAQKVFSKLCKITVEPLMSHGLFYRCPCYVDCSYILAFYGGAESSQIPSKISSFVFRRCTKVLRFWK